MVGYLTFLPESWAVQEDYSVKYSGIRKNLRKFLLTRGKEGVILNMTVERGVLSVLHFLCSSPIQFWKNVSLGGRELFCYQPRLRIRAYLISI
jgi:hypothetical protein